MSQTKAQLLDGKSATIQFTGGSASAPAVSFTGDTNTGIYSPGADQVAISTNGSGRLFVASDGKIGCGISAPSYGLQLINSASSFALGETGSNVRLILNYGSPTSSTAAPTITSDGEGLYYYGRNGYAGQHIFYSGTSNTERLRITAAGLVGVGTSSPGTYLDTRGFASYRGNAYTIASFCANNTLAPLNICQSENGTAPAISAGQNSTGTYQPLVLMTSELKRVLIDSAGNVGIGTTSPTYKLHVVDSVNGGVIFQVFNNYSGAGTSNNAVVGCANTNNYFNMQLLGQQNFALLATDSQYTLYRSPIHVFQNSAGTTEYGRFDGSGRLLVGTSSARANFFNSTISSGIQLEGAGIVPSNRFLSVVNNYATAGDGGGVLILGRSKGGTVGSNDVVASGDQLGRFDFQGSDGTELVSGAMIEAYVDGTPGANDMPGRLVFSTTADGASSPTERMRILESGRIWFGNTSSLGNYKYHFPYTGGSTNGIILRNTDNSGGPSAIGFEYGTTQVGYISVSSTTTTYATTSDYRAKENVTAVNDGITRLQQLKPSRFNFIADPAKTVDGFIAHEVQSVVPEAITGEKDAVDDDGNPIYQGIDQSKLVPLLTAALQEAIGEIESLKARVAALESA